MKAAWKVRPDLATVAVAFCALSGSISLRGNAQQPTAGVAVPIMIDRFDSVSHWSTNPSDGVAISIHSDTGRNGAGIRMDFDFQGNPGYAIVHRDVDLDLPENYDFSFSIRGSAPHNTLEFKLVDRSHANVWWANSPNFLFAPEWRTISFRKRQICFAWGPGPSHEIHHVASIEFAITAGTGGKGSVWIDDLAFTPRDVESPFDVTRPDSATPIVGTWEAATADQHNSGATLDFTADKRFTLNTGIIGKFHYRNANGHLMMTFRNPETGKMDESSEIVSIAHDTLIVGANLGMKMHRMRPALPADEPIIGEWTQFKEPEGTSFIVFRENGTGSFRVPVNSCSGTWTESGKGQLTATLNRVIFKWNYSIENGLLVLRNPDGQEERYNRVLPPAG